MTSVCLILKEGYIHWEGKLQEIHRLDEGIWPHRATPGVFFSNHSQHGWLLRTGNPNAPHLMLFHWAVLGMEIPQILWYLCHVRKRGSAVAILASPRSETQHTKICPDVSYLPHRPYPKPRIRAHVGVASRRWGASMYPTAGFFSGKITKNRKFWILIFHENLVLESSRVPVSTPSCSHSTDFPAYSRVCIYFLDTVDNGAWFGGMRAPTPSQ